jgi:hypothetical protein
MASVRPCTPRELADLFNLLCPEDRLAALTMMAVTAEDLWRVADRLSPLEAARYDRLQNGGRLEVLGPILIQTALDVVLRHPGAGREELLARANEEFGRASRDLLTSAREVEAAELKEARDRKPDPKSGRIREAARRLKAEGRSWRTVAETLWRQHPAWFSDEPHPDSLEDKPEQRKELLSRLTERVRRLCRR